jgi:hypothetical protein
MVGTHWSAHPATSARLAVSGSGAESGKVGMGVWVGSGRILIFSEDMF